MRAIWLLALMSGCKLDLANGVLLCNHDGKACPDGYHCAANDTCYRNGADPDLSMQMDDLAAGSDGARDDLAPAPDLTALKHQGDPCVAGVDVCDTGHCVDGYCCNSDCTDACGACDVSSSLGICSAVMGPSHGTRACSGSGTCGGTCAGKTTTCSYPAATVICGAACDGHCDGNGGCSSAGGGMCANGFACGTNACLTVCATPADCQQPNFTCVVPSCVRVPESDCLDGVDNNGDGKIDCDDPTCSNVECVDAVGNGNEAGFFTSGSCPASGFVTETQNQNLSQPSCGGCSCTNSTAKCYVNGTFYYGAGDTGCSVSSSAINVQLDGTCQAIPSHVYNSYKMGASTHTGGCSATGSPTLPASTFANPYTFCGASRISTNNCNGNSSKICITKRPPATTLCARVTSGGCPAGYTGGTIAVYYTGISPGSCGSCGGCDNPTNFDCRVDPVNLYNLAACGTTYGTTPLDSSGCQTMFNLYSNGNPASLSGYTIAGLAAYQGYDTISCSASSVTTNYATAIGASTICCP